jgi:acetoin utilization deacetylase AcuC-like enzyme
MRRTGIVWDERFLLHDTGPGHPERADRLRAIHAGLKDAGLLDRATIIGGEPVDLDWVREIHCDEYIARLKRACEMGKSIIDAPDSTICPQSFEIARVAVGGVLAAVDAVMRGAIANAFCPVRPPGHHAERDRSMGFCLFNNVAIAARYLQKRHGLKRILILDWDVHHGNGTQHTFDRDPSVFFCSIHQHPHYLYPGTGHAHETGQGEGVGTTLDLPMLPHATDRDAMTAYQESFLPAATAFAPEFVLVSTGYDGHRADPLASLDWTDQVFAWLTDQALLLADELCGGRFVSVLEGGYDLDVLARCAARHVELLMADVHPDPELELAAELTDMEREIRRASRVSRSDAIWWW